MSRDCEEGHNQVGNFKVSLLFCVYLYQVLLLSLSLLFPLLIVTARCRWLFDRVLTVCTGCMDCMFCTFSFVCLGLSKSVYKGHTAFISSSSSFSSPCLIFLL